MRMMMRIMKWMPKTVPTRQLTRWKKRLSVIRSPRLVLCHLRLDLDGEAEVEGWDTREGICEVEEEGVGRDVEIPGHVA